MADTLLRTNETIEQSSDGALFYEIDFGNGWFPDDAISISSADVKVYDSSGVEVTGKVTSVTHPALTVLFKLSSLDAGSYKLYTTVTCNTGDVDTCETRVEVPY